MQIDNADAALSTGRIGARGARMGGVEAGLGWGRLWAQAELYGIAVQRGEGGQTGPLSGYYVQAAYTLVGKPRTWKSETASWGSPRPEQSFDPRHDAWGALEIAARFSSADLNAGDIKGGHIYGMSGTELKRAQALLRSAQKTADALGYRVALKGNEGAWYHVDIGHGDPEELDKINHGKSIEERNAAEDAYNVQHDETLKAELAAARTDDERSAVIQHYRDSGKSQLIQDADAYQRLLDIAAQIEGEVAVLRLADPGSPTLIQDKDAKGALYVLMPMRV